MNHATPELAGALSAMLDMIDKTLRENGYAGESIRMFLAGGLAINYYCGSRVTGDVDATFSRRVTLDVNDLIVDFRDANGKPTQLYFDATYSPALSPMHEDYEGDAQEWVGIGNERRLIHLMVLAPVDVAVSKLVRFEAHDRADIRDLGANRYFSAEEFHERAEAAASYYVGSLGRLRTNIGLAYQDIVEVQAAPSRRLRP